MEVGIRRLREAIETLIEEVRLLREDLGRDLRPLQKLYLV